MNQMKCNERKEGKAYEAEKHSGSLTPPSKIIYHTWLLCEHDNENILKLKYSLAQSRVIMLFFKFNKLYIFGKLFSSGIKNKCLFIY